MSRHTKFSTSARAGLVVVLMAVGMFVETQRALAANPVVINRPTAGSGVTYPFTASGTCDSTATLQGEIRVPSTGQIFNGAVVQGAPNWQIRFVSGPAVHATLKITDTTNNLFASESINGTDNGGGGG